MHKGAVPGGRQTNTFSFLNTTNVKVRPGLTTGTNNPQKLVLGLVDGLTRMQHILAEIYSLYFLIGDAFSAYCMR